MESNVVKAAIGFAIVMIAGFIIVGTTAKRRKKNAGRFPANLEPAEYLALDKCTEAVKNEVGSRPYSPSESDSDHVKYVTLIWNNIGSAKRVECRYVMDQGLRFSKSTTAPLSRMCRRRQRIRVHSIV